MNAGQVATCAAKYEAKRGRGRPPSKDRAPDGLPARVRLLWVNHGTTHPGAQCELFSSDAAALRLVAAWARRDCVPQGLTVERKGAAGWVAV